MVFIRDALSGNVERWSPEAEGKIYFILKLGNTKIGLLFVYNPPVNSPYANEDFLGEIEEDLASMEHAGVTDFLILGDFNARTGSLDDRVPPGILDEDDGEVEEDGIENIPERASMDNTWNSRGVELIDFAKSTSTCIF